MEQDEGVLYYGQYTTMKPPKPDIRVDKKANKKKAAMPPAFEALLRKVAKGAGADAQTSE